MKHGHQHRHALCVYKALHGRVGLQNGPPSQDWEVSLPTLRWAVVYCSASASNMDFGSSWAYPTYAKTLSSLFLLIAQKREAGSGNN